MERLTKRNEAGQAVFGVAVDVSSPKAINELWSKIIERLCQHEEWNCVGCVVEKDMPSHIKCQGCARMYADKYTQM